MSVIIADKLDGLESDISLTIIEYESEYGSISAAFSSIGLSITTTRNLPHGYFEEITYSFRGKNDWSQSLQPAPAFGLYEDRQVYTPSGAWTTVGAMALSLIAVGILVWALSKPSSNKEPAGSYAFSLKP